MLQKNNDEIALQPLNRDIFSRIYAAFDADGHELYNYGEQDSFWFSPPADLLHFIRFLLQEEPEAFPLTIRELPAGDWAEPDAEVFATIKDRRDSLALAARFRNLFPRGGESFFVQLGKRVAPRLARLTEAEARHEEVLTQLGHLWAKRTSLYVGGTERVIAERVASGRPRFLPVPREIKALHANSIDFETRLADASTLYFGPLHNNGVIWFCEGSKPGTARWKWRDVTIGNRGLAVSRNGRTESVLPVEVAATCAAYTGLLRMVIFRDELETAAAAAERLLSDWTPRDLASADHQRHCIDEEMSALRLERNRLAQMISEHRLQTEFWEGGIPEGEPPCAPLSGRQVVKLFEDGGASGYRSPTYDRPPFRELSLRRQDHLGLEDEWVDCDERDLFFSSGRRLACVRLRDDMPGEGEERVFDVYEVSIVGGIRRKARPITRLLGDPALVYSRIAVDYNRFCILVVGHVAQRAAEPRRSRVGAIVEKLRHARTPLFKRRAEIVTPAWVKRVREKTALGHPMALTPPEHLQLPKRNHLHYSIFMKEAGALAFDPVFWKGAVWLFRGEKPAGAKWSQSDLSLAPSALRIGPDGRSVQPLPADIAAYAFAAHHVTRRLLSPDAIEAVVAWAEGELPRLAWAAGNSDHAEMKRLDRKIAHLTARIERMEGLLNTFPRASPEHEFFAQYLHSWRRFF
ncbi:hypothetical protein GOA99_18665 [Sinorhizobium meliloti]|nr:hypothetical protein [Sinorhizobium meliloti]